MTDQLYVASGYVVTGYSAYVADGNANLPIDSSLTCESSSPVVAFSCDMSVVASTSAQVTRIKPISSDLVVDLTQSSRIGVIKKCDANLLLVDAFQDVVVNRTRDNTITTEAIFTELAAIAKIGDFFVNCEINSEVSANVHVITGNSANLLVDVSSNQQSLRVRDGYSALQVTFDSTTLNSATKDFNAQFDAFASELSVGTRTSDNHADLAVTSDLTAHNYRLKDYAVDMQAFASEMTHNERVSDVNANLIAEAALSATTTRIKAIDASLSVDTAQSTYNLRVSEFRVSMDAFASELTQGTNTRPFHANLTTTANQVTRNSAIKEFDCQMDAFASELSVFKRNVVFRGDEHVEFVSKSEATVTRTYNSHTAVTASLTATGLVTKTLTSSLEINASMASRPIEYRGFDSDLTVPTSVVTVPTRTSSNTSTNVVTASIDARNVRNRLAQIHTDVVATELAAFAKIGAFFINSEVNTIMSCDSHIIASGSSPMAVTATQTSRVEKNSDNRTNCTVDVSSSCRNIRVTNSLVNLVSEIQVNTSVSKVSLFNSQPTVVSTAHTRLFKLSHLHSSMLSEVTQTSQLIRQNFARSSMSTAVTIDSQARRLSRNSSHMDVTAESLIWANRLKETVVDMHFNAAVQASFRNIGSIRVNPMNVSIDMVSFGHLFYLDMRYGWNIENEDRNYLLRTDGREHSIEYEDRTFQMGRI